MAAASVLVVEDDATIVRAIGRNLVVRGYAMRGAGTVAEAMAALGATPADVVLLDIDLPDGSGWDIARHLRRGGQAPSIVIMSALRPNPRLIEELGIVGVLEKPFPMESLLRLVAEATSRATGAPSAEAEAEGYGNREHV